jgi:hypothetical protein
VALKEAGGDVVEGVGFFADVGDGARDDATSL